MPASPEQHARQTIDAQLAAARWVVQDVGGLNLSAARGVVVREMQSQGGPADYVLFVDGKAIGVLEAKKAGTTLSGVAEQSQRYNAAKKWILQRWADPLPFTYESTGIETNFRDRESEQCEIVIDVVITDIDQIRHSNGIYRTILTSVFYGNL